jgi:hypothetical protein
MSDGWRLTIGGAAGSLIAAAVSPLVRPFLHPPTGGVGFVTVNAYPKGYDYALVALLALGACAGAVLATWFRPSERAVALGDVPRWRRLYVVASLVVFALMLFIHDHPYVLMDPFHEGEHLTPAFLLKSGERPYLDFFVLHGLGADGALDAVVLGDPPSPHRSRRLETVLDAATLALLVPIAAEVCTTPVGVAIAVFASLCAVAAGQLPVFPYYRLAPVLLACLGLLRYVRRGGVGPLFLAFGASTLGLLWSLDTGSYALVATAASFIAIRASRSEAEPLPAPRAIALAAIAVAMPFAILLACGAGVRQFLVDSFVTIPHSIDAVWSLPAPPGPTLSELWRWLDSESARFYLPPAIYGAFIALAFQLYRRGNRAAAARVFIVAMASLVVFRTAMGRVAWSHTRYGVPLLGIAVIAFVVEPLWRTRRRVLSFAAAVLLAVLVEPRANVIAGAKLLAGWHGRQSHAGLVAYPFKTGKGIYTTAENAADLAALNGFVESVAAPGATILDFSNERALYYLLQRKPPVRCFDIPMLSAPALRAEAMRQLDEHPPACVVMKGIETIGSFDGVPNGVRVPELALWIDAHYPRRVQIGRFVVAAP